MMTDDNFRDRLKVEARKNFEVTGEEETTDQVTVEAKNGSGSRYVVIATRLGRSGRHSLGGDMLVSLLWPWQTCWTMQSDGVLATSYVSEHFAYPGDSAIRSPADLMGVAMTIGRALGREVLDG